MALRYDKSLGMIAKTLRATEEVALESLPERWIDLIHQLNEQERKRSKTASRQEVGGPNGVSR